MGICHTDPHIHTNIPHRSMQINKHTTHAYLVTLYTQIHQTHIPTPDYIHIYTDIYHTDIHKYTLHTDHIHHTDLHKHTYTT